MNPYAMLQKLHEVGGLDATLTKKDGRRVSLVVSPESNESRDLVSDYPAALKIRFWSCDSQKLGEVRPDEGDALAVRFPDGERVYKTTRDPISARYWNFKYDRNKARVVFVTKYEAVQ